MKSVLAIAAFLPFMAHASITVSALHSLADSTDIEATQLTQKLKSLGAKGYTDPSGHASVSLKGEITLTGGAGCDNGHNTYHITLVELNADGKELQTFDVDDSNGCEQPSQAEKFNALLGKWGGETVQDDCGLGHCWKKIDSIQCKNFPSSKASEGFDSCDVEMSSGN